MRDCPVVCGFAGELRFDGRPADAAALARMAETMAPRGPDGSGLWLQDGAGLAHRRLKIIDLSERGAQPMLDPHLGLAVAFNGCIYNYKELRKELAADGYSFASTSDTEVLMKAYHRWGPAFVERLKGMFAFVLVEQGSGPRGARPRPPGHQAALHGRDAGGALRVASTLPALLAGGDVDTELDPIALHHYLSWHAVVPAPHTILRGVRKLAPGTLLVVEPDGARREVRYWDPRYERNPDNTDLDARRVGRGGARRDARRRAPADGRRRARRRAALRRAGLEPDRRAARAGGPDRPADVLDRLRGGRRPRGRRVRLLRPRRRDVRHRPPQARDRAPTACCPPSRGRSRR